MKILTIEDAKSIMETSFCDKPRVIVTGVSGQDGSFMVEYLLNNTDLIIFGGARRLSVSNHENIKHLDNHPRFKLVNFDLTDSHSIERLIKELKPAYFINFAAQSFVKSSWDFPEQTWNTNCNGVLHILEAVRLYAPKCRVYQAGSSEEFGNVSYSPQDEEHPLKPRSPYGASKAGARHLIKVYRESYNIYAVQGWLFNHECLTEETPIILKNKNTGNIEICPISEIVPYRKNPEKGKRYSTDIECDYDVWDGGKWTKIKTRTATWNDSNTHKEVIRVMGRGGFYEATSDHLSFIDKDVPIATGNLKKGHELSLKPLPSNDGHIIMSSEEAEFIGLMISEGNICNSQGQFTNKDNKLLRRTSQLWENISGGYTTDRLGFCGYTGKKDVTQLYLNGNRKYLNLLESEIYTKDGKKKIPTRILNAPIHIVKAFLTGYNNGDGLKAGNQKTELKGFTTSSHCLAMGLWFLLNSKLKLRTILCPEIRNNNLYFHININSSKKGNSGNHFIKSLEEITKIQKLNYRGWLFDLETSSGTFSAGIGNSWVHNSSRRGEEFVTRKITKGVARIVKAIKQNSNFDPIELGNLFASRDWSDARDFMDAIWKMLHQPDNRTPSGLKDYVVASGETHTIKEFIEIAFKTAGIEGYWKTSKDNDPLSSKYCFNNLYTGEEKILVTVNKKYYRPAEVDSLMGNPALIKKELGWNQTISFNELVKTMIMNDLTLEGTSPIYINNEKCQLQDNVNIFDG